MRVTAQTVLAEDLEFRQVISARIDKRCRSKKIKLNYLQSKLNDYLSDLVDFLNINASCRVAKISGFEGVKYISRAAGYATVYANIDSNHMNVDLVFYIPIYRGAFLKPSVMVLDGKRSVFSRVAIQERVESYNSKVTYMLNEFGKNMNIYTSEISRGDVFHNFEKPQSEYAMPYFELYIPDMWIRTPGARSMVGI